MKGDYYRNKEFYKLPMAKVSYVVSGDSKDFLIIFFFCLPFTAVQ